MKTTDVKIPSQSFSISSLDEIEKVRQRSSHLLTLSLGSFSIHAFKEASIDLYLTKNEHRFYVSPSLKRGGDNKPSSIQPFLESLVLTPEERDSLTLMPGLYIIDGGMISGKTTFLTSIASTYAETCVIPSAYSHLEHLPEQSKLALLRMGEPDAVSIPLKENGEMVKRTLFPLYDEAYSLYNLARLFLSKDIELILIDSLKLQLYNTAGAAMAKGMKPLFLSDLSSLSTMCSYINLTCMATVNSLDVTALHDVEALGTEAFSSHPYYFSLGGSVSGVFIFDKLYRKGGTGSIYSTNRFSDREPVTIKAIFKKSEEKKKDFSFQEDEEGEGTQPFARGFY